MATITLQGTPIHTVGKLPATGGQAPDFKLVAEDLSDKTLGDFADKVKILNIVPSLDTEICSLSAKRFNQEATQLKNTVVINISADLPFAQKRFCETEGLSNLVNLSTFRSPDFGRDYGVTIVDGPLTGLMSRCVLILDTNNHVVYGEQVPEIVQEPDYDKALSAVRCLCGLIFDTRSKKQYVIS